VSTHEPHSTSPKWGATTKLIVGLTFVALVAALLIKFRTLIGPLLLAFVLIYLLYPIATRLSRLTKLSWRMSVNLVFLVLIILVIAFLTMAGLAVFQQIQSLVGVVQEFVKDIPTLAADLSNRIFHLGPYVFNLKQFDLQTLSQQLLSYLEPMLGRVGGLISALATGAAVMMGWGLFVMLISYFILTDAGRVSGELFTIDIPGYYTDIRRLGTELRNIWNAFLRGQFLILLLVLVLYTLLMTVLGVRYALGIALLAGLARFVPYIGPLTNYSVMVLVILFQGDSYFGLPAWQHILIVIGFAILIDQALDNLIVPRFLGNALGIHPAAVLVAALIAANLIGIVGLVLAAPTVATLNLLGRYTVRKMLDLDPWPTTFKKTRFIEFPWTQLLARLLAWLRKIRLRKPIS